METKARRGLMKGLRRSVLGGESFFINTFRSSAGGAVSVARSRPGDMTSVAPDGAKALFVQSGSWLASDNGIELIVSGDLSSAGEVPSPHLINTIRLGTTILPASLGHPSVACGRACADTRPK